MIDMSKNRNWLLRKVAQEDQCLPYAAGLAYDLGFIGRTPDRTMVALYALARFIRLWRRQNNLSLGAMANRVGVSVEQMVLLERGEGWIPRPEALRRLARAVNLGEDKLLQLFGFAEMSSSSIRDAVIRFVEQSEQPGELSVSEKSALDQFVSSLR